MENLNSVGENLINRWFQAYDDKLDTKQRITLYEDTKNTFEGKTPEQIKIISKAILDNVKARSPEESNKLALFITENTRADQKDSWLGYYNGAYRAFHSLEQQVAKNTGYEGEGWHGLYTEITHYLYDQIIGIDKESKPFTDIDNAAVGLIKNQAWVNLPPEIKSKILGMAGPRETRSMASTNWENKNAVDDNKLGILIEQMNKGTDVRREFKDVDDMIAFFGKSCSKVEHLDLLAMTIKKYEDDDLEKIFEAFPNLKFLELPGNIIIGKDLLPAFEVPNLEHLTYTACWSYDSIKYLRAPNLKTLDFVSTQPYHPEDLSFLESFTSITKLRLTSCSILDTSTLEPLTNLKELHLDFCIIYDPNLLETLKSKGIRVTRDSSWVITS